jgi:proteasome lid subunit RPN8/RPN11
VGRRKRARATVDGRGARLGVEDLGTDAPDADAFDDALEDAPDRESVDDADPRADVPPADRYPAGSDHALAAVLDAVDRDPPADAHDDDEATAKLRAAITLGPTVPVAGDGPEAGGPAGPVSPLDVGHPEFQSIVRRSVVEEIRAHAEANPDIEVCGILVGTVYEGAQASFVYADAMIRGESSAGRSTQVTFTAETWQHVHRVMEERHAGKRILGWYHTHPGFGIFLSEMDLFIQRHFFNAPWQVAFVYDPQSRDAGMFAWRAAQVRRVDFVLDDETGPTATAGGAAAATAARVQAAAVAGARPAPAADAAGGHGDPTAPIVAATMGDLADRVRVLEGRVRSLLVGFAILLVATIIWPLVVQVVMPPAASARSPGPSPDAPVTVSPGPTPVVPARPKPDRNFPVIP